jgi:hypothetical protein
VVQPGVCAFKINAPHATSANNDPFLILCLKLLSSILLLKNERYQQAKRHIQSHPVIWRNALIESGGSKVRA